MDGDVVEFGRYCGHGIRAGKCWACNQAAPPSELEQLQNQVTALNQQNMIMWYALQGIAEGGCDPRGWAKDVLANLAKGTTFKGGG